MHVTDIQAMGIPDGPWHDRQTSMECSEWRFSRGEPYTLVALTEPLNNTRVEDHVRPCTTTTILPVALPPFSHSCAISS